MKPNRLIVVLHKSIAEGVRVTAWLEYGSKADMLQQHDNVPARMVYRMLEAWSIKCFVHEVVFTTVDYL